MLGDLFNVKSRIKAIDRYFNIDCIGNGQYEITHKGGHFMSIPHYDLNGGIVEKIREIVYRNVNADIIAEIEANNNKIDSRKERDFQNLSEDMAKDLLPYIRRLEV